MTIQRTDFSQCRGLITGEVTLECYALGSTRRISPEAPKSVVNIERIQDRAGVLVTRGDFDDDEIVGAVDVRNVCTMPWNLTGPQGRSTSKIISAIVQSSDSLEALKSDDGASSDDP